MELHFLGTGAGMPSKERNTTAIVLKLLDEIGELWLFDCGEATQHQILHTHLKPRKITKIFITHMHGDHIFGLPGLLSSRSFQSGEETLTIYGPKGIAQFVEMALTLSQTHVTYPISYVEVTDGVIYEDEQFIVEVASLAHVIPCYGYRITQKPLPGALQIDKALALGVPKGPLLGRLKNGESVQVGERTITSKDVVGEPKLGAIVTILGDTSYTDNAINLAKDATVLVHEATFLHDLQPHARKFGHATAQEAAQVAQQAGVDQLILTHISSRYLAHEMPLLKAEASAVFPQVTIAYDQLVYPIK